jgi:hypothetical protein
MSAGSSALSPQTTRSPPGGWARSCWWPATAWCCSPVAARTPGRHPRAGGHAVLPPGLPGRGGGCGDHPAGLAHRPGPLLIHSPEPWTVPEPAVLARGIGATRKQRRVSPHPPAALLGALAAGAPACGAFAAARRRPQAGLPVGLRSAPQAVRLRAATAAPLRSAHPSRQARRAPVTPRAHSRLRVTPLASLRLESCRGASPPRPPAPLRPADRAPRHRTRPCPLRAPRPRRSPWRAERQGSHRTRGTLRAHGFNPVQARSPRAIMSAGCRRPGGPSCARPRRRRWRARVQRALAPAAAGRRGPPRRRQGRCGGRGSHAGPAAASAGPAAGVRCARRPTAFPAPRPGPSPRAPLARHGLNPAHCAARRQAAAGCAGGLTPSRARGSSWGSPRRVVRPAPLFTRRPPRPAPRARPQASKGGAPPPLDPRPGWRPGPAQAEGRQVEPHRGYRPSALRRARAEARRPRQR